MSEPIRLLGPTWTEDDMTKLDNISKAYLHLRAYCDRLEAENTQLSEENQQLSERRLWGHFWAFWWGAFAMAVVVGVMSAATRW